MISIIVPIYNIEDYLRSCLDSILNQTYSDFELILVDDGSVDRSGLICDEYAGQDSRIIVIHQENQGLPAARNVGLKRMRGYYVTMIDGDDCVHTLFLEILYKLITSGDYDFSMCSYQSIDDIDEVDLSHLLLEDECSQPQVISGHDCMYNLYKKKGDMHYAVVWNKLYRQEVVEDVYFKNDAAQDVEFNNQIYQRANKVVFLDENLYFYVRRIGSFQHRGLTRRHFETILTLESCLSNIPSEQKAYHGYCLSYLYGRLLSISYDAYGTDHYDYVTGHVNRIRSLTQREYISNLDISFVKKRAILLFLNHLRLYRMILSAINKIIIG